jgi:hypothetical protein
MKREGKPITLGSGKIYIMPYTDTVPAHTDICKPANLLGYIKGGASLAYTEETTEEKDDLGYVSKIITTTEEVLLKCGLITWNGETLDQLIDRCSTSVKDGLRTTKIGGPGNAKGAYYAVCFHYEDPKDGDVWVLIVGRNTAGAELTFATDAGTVIEPEFKALPQDDDGTLVQFIEQVTTGTAGA